MAVENISFEKLHDMWVSAPVQCRGGDVRVRVHKKGPYPVNLLVSIDGEEEYIKYDDFGLDELKCEVTLEGAMRGQHVMLSSRSELLLVKIMQL
ncbi:MAG: hypothetical protein IKL75_03385 [Bacteroidaceae bacterium]|nr:hypothetical protein [Bacteroidaceae bacterium]